MGTASFVLAVWFGILFYNVLALKLPVRTSLILPAVQVFWMALSLIGMVLYQWPARIVALLLISLVVSFLIYRGKHLDSN
jgi:hypothetical protein